MSDRGSFTTEFMYGINDHRIVKEAFEKARDIRVINSSSDLPIISGYVRAGSINGEWMIIEDALYGLKTDLEVRCIIVCEGGSIMLVIKHPDGSTDYKDILNIEEESYKKGYNDGYAMAREGTNNDINTKTIE